MELNELRDSKLYVKGTIPFPSPKLYTDPFLDAVGYDDTTDTIKLVAQNEVVNVEDTENHERNTAYPRFMLEVNKGFSFGDEIADYNHIYGMIVAMDVGNPIVKYYTGEQVMACTNLAIWNAEHKFQRNLMDDDTQSIETLKRFYAEQDSIISDYKETHELLCNTFYNQQQLEELLGSMLRRSFASDLGSTPVVGGAKLLTQSTSIYYANGSTTAWNVYNAFTGVITASKDILSKPNKTLAVTKLMGIN